MRVGRGGGWVGVFESFLGLFMIVGACLLAVAIVAVIDWVSKRKMRGVDKA